MGKQKVAVVGTGMVGASYAYSLVNQGLVDELLFINIDKKQAQAHADDIIHGTCFLPKQPKIFVGDFKDCTDADVVCITAGAAQLPGETRLDLVEKNAKIMKTIVSQVMESGFDGIILIASNPVDIMTQVAQKVSGLPHHKVIGSGTTLDTARFRSNLANYLGYNSTNIHAYIIGEHGDSSLPWSTATLGQHLLLDVVNDSNGKFNMEGLKKCYTDSRDAAYSIIEGKGSTYFGIGIALTKITKSILSDQDTILTVSAYLDGEYNQKGIYIPVPCMVGKDGIKEIQKLHITQSEQELFDKSCDTLREYMKKID